MNIMKFIEWLLVYLIICTGKCRNKGILFVAIDQNRPLSDQGPFDIVLHKVSLSVEFPWKKPCDFGGGSFYVIITECDSESFLHHIWVACVISDFYFFTICWVPVVCSWFCMVLMAFQLFMTAPFLCLFFLRAVVRKRVASDSRG